MKGKETNRLTGKRISICGFTLQSEPQSYTRPHPEAGTQGPKHLSNFHRGAAVQVSRKLGQKCKPGSMFIFPIELGVADGGSVYQNRWS